MSGQLRQLQCWQASGSFEGVTDGSDAACGIQVALGRWQAILGFDPFGNLFSERGQVGWGQGPLREQRVLFHDIGRAICVGARPFDGRFGRAGDWTDA